MCRKEIPADGMIVSMIMGVDGTVLIQLEGGALYTYKLYENDRVSHQKSLPETCETLKVGKVNEITNLFTLYKFIYFTLANFTFFL